MSSKMNTARKSESTEPSEVIISKALENPENTPTYHKQNVTNGVDRQEMIATAAYYRAERRGFNSGDEIQDWLEAEAEIDGLI
jgi:hypothetical protein